MSEHKTRIAQSLTFKGDFNRKQNDKFSKCKAILNVRFKLLKQSNYQ